MLVVFSPLRYQFTIHLSRNMLSIISVIINSGLARAVYWLHVNKYAITMPTMNTKKRSKLMNSPSNKVSTWRMLSTPSDSDKNICNKILAEVITKAAYLIDLLFKRPSLFLNLCKGISHFFSSRIKLAL